MSDRRIEVLARGVCIVHGHLLLCRCRGASNTFLPGGHVEFRERAAVALEREIREELGLTARAQRFLGCCEHTFRQRGRWHAEVNLVFEMIMPGARWDRPLESRESWLSFCWQPLRQLADAGLEPAPLCRLIPKWIKDGGARFTSSGKGWGE